jgi:hypothetical protein
MLSGLDAWRGSIVRLHIFSSSSVSLAAGIYMLCFIFVYLIFLGSPEPSIVFMATLFVVQPITGVGLILSWFWPVQWLEYTLPLPITSSVLVEPVCGDVDRGRASGQSHTAGGQHGRMINRVAATGLPGHNERVCDAPPAGGE